MPNSAHVCPRGVEPPGLQLNAEAGGRAEISGVVEAEGPVRYGAIAGGRVGDVYVEAWRGVGSAHT